MKAYLMFRDRDFDEDAGLPFGSEALVSDLELERLLSSMAGRDSLIYSVCRTALLSPLQMEDEIKYRQDILKDCLRQPEAVRALYKICLDTERRRRDSWCTLSSRWLSSTFSSAVELLHIYIEMLMELRKAADRNIESFSSEGFKRFFEMLRRELSDEYFAHLKLLLSELRESSGTLISSGFGSYLQGVNYTFRQKEHSVFNRQWWFAPSYTIGERDDAGATDLVKRRDRAINEAANALAQSAEHLQGFFDMLRRELAFYVGCLNLRDGIKSCSMPLCFPDIYSVQCRDRSWSGLYDLSLALLKKGEVVGNELTAGSKSLYIITGANQGGKTTFLRSLGQAQLMAQCGMFAAAESFICPIRRQLFTHFKREEDKALKSGRLDEELERMSRIADHLGRGCMLLFNESFSSTNEREGSEICSQITRALVENGVEVFSVTHLYTFASGFRGFEGLQYLRAQRLENGERSFKLLPGEPLETAFGDDLYKKIFTEDN